MILPERESVVLGWGAFILGSLYPGQAVPVIRDVVVDGYSELVEVRSTDNVFCLISRSFEGG